VTAAPVALIDDPERVRAALTPLRRRLLQRLRRPASATELAAELSMGRQRVNYHLRALEGAGLLELVEARQRRGCIERILAARAQAFVVDPAVVGAQRARAVRAATQDRFSAEHLIHTAGDVVRQVARMQAGAEREGARLLTFTIDTEISFATPRQLERFTTALADFIARQGRKVDAGAGGRRYRIVAGAHPAPRKQPTSRRAS
jgi:DNA-binding transcriptional ArsR family regulator